MLEVSRTPLPQAHSSGSLPSSVKSQGLSEVQVSHSISNSNNLLCYSCTTVHIGAAALLIREGEQDRTLHDHLGPSSLHTVHEAELVGLLLGLHLIKTERRGRTSFAVGADNQAARSTLNSVKSTTGQYIADEISKTAASIKKQRNSGNYSLTFRWAAGHVGIKGNEEVDGEAKKAAEGLSSGKKELPPLLRKPLKHNKAALRQQRRDVLKARWKKEWEASTRANKFKALDLTAPSDIFIKLISDDKLSRNDASRIFQLRTGHVPLNAYLERFKRVDRASCPACDTRRKTLNTTCSTVRLTDTNVGCYFSTARRENQK